MKYFLFIDTWLLNQIDFSEVLENDVNELRYSLDNNRTYVSWLGDTPNTITNLLNNHPYSINTEEESNEIFKQEEWSGDWNIYG